MPKTYYFEQQFFNALRDIFVGATIEGESGYINLMRIKSRYYTQGVFPHLKKDIDTAIATFPEFREELFDKLYSFFKRYFSESGSIYFRYTPLHNNIYEKVYTDDRDVVLFWKTHMLYYVKTDRIFNSLGAEIDGIKFWFDASQIEHKRANEKRQVVFTFKEARQDDTLVFTVTYSERGSKTKEEETLKALKEAGYEVSDEMLNKAFRVFEKQSEVDFFINKDARSFLREQFELWMYQYLFEGQNVWSAERLAQLQALKEISFKVIDFISQFEDELVKLWNKPKFVRNSHYVITLNNIASRDANSLIEKLFTHPGMQAQFTEWKELGFVDDVLNSGKLLELVNEKDLTGAPIHAKYQYLPFDTRYFPNLEMDILALFDNLDNTLDGWLIHSENYQALKSLSSKYNNKCQTIYIDPPYNTDASEIIYINNYKHASWMTLLQNRLSESKGLLKEKGIICITIDHAELSNLKAILDSEFESNLLGLVTIKNNPSGRSTVKGFSIANEFALFYGKSENSIIGYVPRSEEQLSQYSETDKDGPFQWRNFLRSGGMNDFRSARPRLFYPIYIREDKYRIPIMMWDSDNNSWQTKEIPAEGEKVIYPISIKGIECTWRLGVETLKNRLDDLRVVTNQSGEISLHLKFRMGEEGVLPKTIWDDPKFNATVYGTSYLRSMFDVSQIFSFPKSIYAVEESIKVCNVSHSDTVLDYFAGSGTTAHAVMNLNREDGGKRKYILVEMGDHFNTVILPRIKKVAFNSKWKDGKPVFIKGESGMSQFVKYYDLEQYDEVLQKARYSDADLFDDPNQDPYHAYVFLRDLKLLESLEIDQETNQVHFHPERLYPDIDLAETLSQLRGKWIKRITREYVEFQDGERMSLENPDWHTLKPMIWWQ